MFLVDTNIWLELLLEQEKAAEVRAFLQAVDASRLYISEFTLYSIGVIVTRLKRDELFNRFIHDIGVRAPVNRVRLHYGELEQLIGLRQSYRLDFDDAYQYLAAAKYALTIVSFDSDFDGTEFGRKTPAQCLQRLTDASE